MINSVKSPLKINKNPTFIITLVHSQQIFVSMKTSFVFVFRRRLDQDEYFRLSLTSSEDVFKTSSRRLGQDQYIRLGHTYSRRLQDVLNRSCQDVFKTSRKNFFRTSSKRLQDVFKTSSRHLQDVFKTYHQVKLFLLTSL